MANSFVNSPINHTLGEQAADSGLPGRQKAWWSSARKWSVKGSLALLDQGLISGANFVIAVILARTLAASDYGVYALAFEVFLFLSVFCNSLILEPMSVFGASAYREHGREYFGALLRVHAVMSAVIVAVIASAAWVAHVFAPASSLVGALIGVSVAGPIVLFYWIARRAFYMKLLPHRAVSGGGIYFAVLMAGLFLLYRWKLLSPCSAFLLIAAGAALASVSMLKALKPQLRAADDAYPRPKEILRRHWVYGRWALASAVPGWLFSGAMYYPLLGHFNGLADAGEFKALLNLNSPVTQAFVAISMLTLPYASGIYHSDGSSSVNRLMWRLTLLYAGGTSLYWAFVTAVRGPAVHALYGGKYAMITSLLPWVAVGSIFRITGSASANVLRAMESPALVCRVYSIVAVIAVLVGVLAIWLYGIKGAVLTFAISGVAASIIAITTVLRKSSGFHANRISEEKRAVVAAEEPSVVS
jgi:O-antigen/teichoic acid export membrane protein